MARPARRPRLLAGGRRLDAASPALLDRTREEVRAWQGDVFELVRREAGGRRATARFASLGVNGAGLVVMLAVFAQTGGLTGAEVASRAARRRPASAFSRRCSATRRFARSRPARASAPRRTRGLLDGERSASHALLAPVAPEPDAAHAPARERSRRRARAMSGRSISA